MSTRDKTRWYFCNTSTWCWKTTSWQWLFISDNATLQINSNKHLANERCGKFYITVRRWMYFVQWTTWKFVTCVSCTRRLTGISYLDMHQKFLATPLQENANLYETRQSTTPFSFWGEGILQHEVPHCLNQSNRSNNMVPQGHQIFF